MKIAVASDGKDVSLHFGRCEGYMIYEIEDNKSLKKEFIQNPGHKPGYLPKFLKELETDVIIAGGMGGTAIQIFNEHGIEVVVGAEGLCDDVVQRYIMGELKSTGDICTDHYHENK